MLNIFPPALQNDDCPFGGTWFCFNNSTPLWTKGATLQSQNPACGHSGSKSPIRFDRTYSQVIALQP